MIEVFFFLLLNGQVDSTSDTTAASTYKLTDFRMPESGAMRFSINLDGSIDNNSYSDWYLPYDPWDDTILSKTKYQERNGSTGGSLYLKRDKEKFSYSITTDVNIFGRSSEESRLKAMLESDTLIGSLYRYSGGKIRVSGEMLYFPFGDIIFIGLESSLANGCLFTRNEKTFEVDSFFVSNQVLNRRSSAKKIWDCKKPSVGQGSR